MLERLRSCREMESRPDQPCLPKHFGASFAGLYRRGMVGLKPALVDGREMMVVYITPAGHALLEKRDRKEGMEDEGENA